jgi:hypothetical protein
VVVHVQSDGLRIGGLVDQRPVGFADPTLEGRAKHAAGLEGAESRAVSEQVKRPLDHGVITLLVLVQLAWVAALVYLAWLAL